MSSLLVAPSMLLTTTTAHPRTIARPITDLKGSRTFPSRNAAAIPITKKLCMNGSSCESTNEIPAASTQYAAGPAKG
jgi:hypothetical protein